jgi:hypothetical protein
MQKRGALISWYLNLNSSRLLSRRHGFGTRRVHVKSAENCETPEQGFLRTLLLLLISIISPMLYTYSCLCYWRYISTATDLSNTLNSSWHRPGANVVSTIRGAFCDTYKICECRSPTDFMDISQSMCHNCSCGKKDTSKRWKPLAKRQCHIPEDFNPPAGSE